MCYIQHELAYDTVVDTYDPLAMEGKARVESPWFSAKVRQFLTAFSKSEMAEPPADH